MIPEKYLKKMSAALSDFEEYAAVLNNEPYKAVRINTLKISCAEFEKISPFPLLDKVLWEENGYYINEEKPGKSALHDLGLFYVQEPSAMSAVAFLDIDKGDKVLDLCSAPGGKGTQIAEKLNGSGIVLMNEKIPDRAKILSRNVERLGIGNAVVTNEDPEIIAKTFFEYFDKVLVDAPCSGEGMFRKEQAAVENWSEENVFMCAERQACVLDCAAKTLKVGGILVYSTCTFSVEEDEHTIENFLKRHTEFELIKQEKLYPHRVKGEGHFVAKLKKIDGGVGTVRKHWRKADKRLINLYRDFEKQYLNVQLDGDFIAFGEKIYLVPKDLFSLEALKVLRAGICLGEHIKGRFEPDHALAIYLKGDDAKNKIELGENVYSYLKGEELSTNLNVKGYCLCTYQNFPVGWGKVSAGAIKNRYPKGLRRIF